MFRRYCLVLFTASMFVLGAARAGAEVISVNAVLEKARAGDAEAQALLAEMYTLGEDVKQDYKKAAKWYHKAAEQGYAAAQANLGWLYAEGRGVKKSDKKAVEWYRKSADQGNADAQTNLGWMYENGRGVKQSDKKAARWYRGVPTRDARARTTGCCHQGQGSRTG